MIPIRFLPRRGTWLIGFVLVAVAVALGACGPAETPTPTPEEPVVAEVPYEEAWAESPHADAESESFVHWDEEDPPEVPVDCAKCHSGPGYRDFLGADGTAAGVVNAAAPIGTVINCVTCHNEAAAEMTQVTFPSGMEVTDLGDEAVCMQCHQGRASTQTVNDAIAEADVGEDTATEDLHFVNIHYYAAAASQYGALAMGGYQYEGKSYDVRYEHVEEFGTCFECHDSHSLELDLAACSECHEDVGQVGDLHDLRSAGSSMDYDGDGDRSEGIYREIDGLQEILLGAMQSYASETAGTPLVYDVESYPYFFVDTNGNGEPDEDETSYSNGYASWTPRLLKAAYNLHSSIKDPGGYAHGGKYHIQLLYDSIEDLDADLVAGLHRIDAGHFAGSQESWRHWDEDGSVPGSCSVCHSATGLPFYLQEGVTASQPPANGMLCTTCHVDAAATAVYTVEQVSFPSGAKLTMANPTNNVCLTCHQGRESTVGVNEATAGLDPDAVAEDLGFMNVHYAAAGATVFGTRAKGAYEYDEQSYVGQMSHPDNYDDCTECHSAHALEVEYLVCARCHDGIETLEDLKSIRNSQADYDGDGNLDEGIYHEISTIYDALYEAIQTYAAEVVGTPIVYDSHAYPYFFVDTNENGQADPDEANYGNSYGTWTPRLLRAAYNYQYATKDHGAYSHNPLYIIQVLQDGLSDLGTQVDVDMTGMVRPGSE